MKDVAVRAGTSVATVSKCLHGVPSIPARTRERVRRIADEMGYRLHPFISALMRNRRKRRPTAAPQPTLAFVTTYPTERGWQKEAFFRAIYAGARLRAEERGYRLSPFWLYRDGMSNARFSEMIWARGIRGLLFNPFPHYGIHLDERAWDDFSVVAHGLSLARPVFHRTTNDHHQSMMVAMAECRRRGYARPALTLDEPTTTRLEYRWEAAYRVCCDKLGFRGAPRTLLLPTRWRPDEISRWVRREGIDVVIGLFLEEQVKALASRGIGESSDVGLLSLSVAYAGSPLSGICQNPDTMGAVAADQLINLVERNETGIPAYPITFTIEGQWNEGRTVRPQAKTPGQRERKDGRSEKPQGRADLAQR